MQEQALQNLPAERFRIMVVDDDECVSYAISEILRHKGWDVEAFDSAETAISELKNSHFDMVLSDINMPGLGGMDFLAKAKEASPYVPVVMVTGYPSIDLAVEAMKMGAVDFLAKPFKTEELEIVVRKSIGESKIHRPDTAAGNGVPGAMNDNTRRRLEDKIKELSILHTMSESLDEAGDKEDVFRKTMNIGQIITDAERVFLMHVDKDSNEMVVRAALGYEHTNMIGKRYRSLSEPFASALKNKNYTYIVVENSELSPLLDGMNGKRQPIVLAPILLNKQPVMLMGLAGREGGGEISTDTLTLIANLTNKASMKLENIALSENIFNSIIGTLTSLINALDARDTYTKDHSNRVTQYALKIAKSFSGEQELLDSISFAGPLHDIGKIAVRDEILLKKGSFTADERELMKSHVLRGEEILRPLSLLNTEKAVVLYHHERWDGMGYPNGLSGDDIPLVARIFSVADTFDAMTSTRPYRNALPFETAREEIVRCSGTQFDPEVVKAFLDSGILKGF